MLPTILPASDMGPLKRCPCAAALTNCAPSHQFKSTPLPRVSTRGIRGLLEILRERKPPFRPCNGAGLRERGISSTPDCLTFAKGNLHQAYRRSLVELGERCLHRCLPAVEHSSLTNRGASASNNLPPLQILPQTTFRNGAAPVDDSVVLFGNVPMSAAARGQVPDPTSPAFTVGDLATQQKATIRFGLPYLEQTGYRPRQHNLQRFEAPVMRGHLAMEIAKEVRRVMDELEEVGRPLTAPGSSSRPVTFDELILVDIRRVSRGSLQPTLAVRGA